MAVIGTIYDKTIFDSLIDFDIKGNWEVVNGKLNTVGNNSNLQFRYASALNNFTWRIRTDSPSLNVQFFGLRAVNNIKTTFTLENGKAKWILAYDNSQGLSTGTLVIDVGDILEYVITKNDWSYQFTVNNITKSTSVSVTPNIAITVHKVIFWSNTTANIISMQKTSQQTFKPLNLLVGDSISYGSSADVPSHRWGTLANFDVLGSPGDTSLEALELIYEIINVIKPKRVIYAFGTNDQNINTWEANLQQFKELVEQKSIVFIPITPYANNIRDMTAFWSYITTTFTKYFDLFSVTKQSSNSNLKLDYDSGDHVHPNTVGHNAIAQAVLSSPYYTFTPIVVQSGIEGTLIYMFKIFNDI